MGELRALVDFAAEHRMPWVTVAVVMAYVTIRRVIPWLADRFTVTDRSTLDMALDVMRENAKLRAELGQLRAEYDIMRKELRDSLYRDPR